MRENANKKKEKNCDRQTAFTDAHSLPNAVTKRERERKKKQSYPRGARQIDLLHIMMIPLPVSVSVSPSLSTFLPPASPSSDEVLFLLIILILIVVIIVQGDIHRIHLKV